MLPSSRVTTNLTPAMESRLQMASEQFKSGQHKSMRAAATACKVKYSTLCNRIQGNHLAPWDAHDGECNEDGAQGKNDEEDQDGEVRNDPDRDDQDGDNEDGDDEDGDNKGGDDQDRDDEDRDDEDADADDEDADADDEDADADDEDADDEDADEVGMVGQQGDMGAPDEASDDNDPDYVPIVKDEPGNTLPNPDEPPPDSVGAESSIPSMWDYRFLSRPSSTEASSMLSGSGSEPLSTSDTRSSVRESIRILSLLRQPTSAARPLQPSSHGSNASSSASSKSENLVMQILLLQVRAAQAEASAAQAHATLAAIENAHLRKLLDASKRPSAKRHKIHTGSRVITCPARAAQFNAEQQELEAQHAEATAKQQEQAVASHARELQRSHNAILKTFEQSIAAYKHKDDLKDIAAAFALDQQGTVAQLLSRIKTYMDLHPELATNPRFQALFMKTRRSRKRRASVDDMSANRNPPLPAILPHTAHLPHAHNTEVNSPLPAIPLHPAHLPHARMAHGSTPAHEWSYPGAAAPVHPGIPSVPPPPHLTHTCMAHASTEFIPGSSSVPLMQNLRYAAPPPSSHPSTGFYCSYSYPDASRCADQYH